MAPQITELPARFRKKVVARPSGCWEWTAYRDRMGYGRYYVEWDKTRKVRIVSLAHRFAYESLVGPIPEGFGLDHLCRNPPCVNPAHLEPVTDQTNWLRGHGPHIIGLWQAAKTHCPFGHEYTAENTFARPNASGSYSRSCRECGRIDSWLRLRRREDPSGHYNREDAPPRARRQHNREYRKRRDHFMHN